jgi:hypothetical protein
MMHKVLPLTALALGLSSGAAFADHRDHRGDSHRDTVVVRDHGGRGNVVVRDHGGNRGGNVVVRDHGGFRGNTVVVRDHGDFRGSNRVIVRGEPRYNHGYYNHGYYNHSIRRPIFVSRPIIRHRYFNYYQRPALIVENYNSMAGYYWVPGHWEWSGYEWIWQPGHYQPDPNYVESYYGY